MLFLTSKLPVSSVRRAVSLFALGVAVCLVGASRVEAGNMLLRIEQGAATFNTSGTPNFVGVFGVTVGDYMISFAGASSNSPGNSFNAFVNTTTLTVTRLTQTSTAPLVLSVLASDFTLPTGNPLYLGSSASATFTGMLEDEVVRFQSFFDPNNTTTTDGFGDGTGTSLITIRGDGSLTDGEGSTSPTIQVARPNLAFALSNITTIDLTELNSTVNTTGATEVRNTPFDAPGIAPEPASVALLAIGGLGLAGATARRKRTSPRA